MGHNLWLNNNEQSLIFLILMSTTLKAEFESELEYLLGTKNFKEHNIIEKTSIVPYKFTLFLKA